MEPIRYAHVSEPGLLVIDVARVDDDTVFASQAAIGRTWGTATAEHTPHGTSASLVWRLRMYTDLRQVLEGATPPERAPATE